MARSSDDLSRPAVVGRDERGGDPGSTVVTGRFGGGPIVVSFTSDVLFEGTAMARDERA
jgi:hypothetical protein